MATLASLLFITLISCVFPAKIPDYIVKCKKDSPDFQKCLATNYAASVKQLSAGGDPAFKLPNLHKFLIPLLDLQASRELRIQLHEIVFDGIDTNVLQDIGMDVHALHIKFFIPHLTIQGRYSMNGKILILPIRGDGDMEIVFDELVVDYTGTLGKMTLKGREHYQMENSPEAIACTLTPKRVHFKFTNLFGGDPKLGEEMNHFLNENWVDVYEEVRLSLQEAAAYTILNFYTNGYFRHIPIDELFA